MLPLLSCFLGVGRHLYRFRINTHKVSQYLSTRPYCPPPLNVAIENLPIAMLYSVKKIK